MNTTVDRNIGENIRRLRSKYGMTQKQLGEKVELSSQQIQKYETGVNRISASLLRVVADIFKVDINYFFSVQSMKDIKVSPSTLVLNDEAEAYEVDASELEHLIEYYNQISDPAIRKQLIDLARTLAKVDYS